MHNKLLLTSFCIFLASLLFYGSSIIKNSQPFDTDEMYWIQTAKIVPLLLGGDISNSFWNEYYGFVNFNTAKIVFGIGLPIFGHTNFNKIKPPPYSYYQWKEYGGKTFPKKHELYTTLRDARFISSLFVALAATGIFVSGWLTTSSYLIGLLASLMFSFHPIIQSIATRALADSIFLFFEVLTVLILIKTNILLQGKHAYPLLYYIGIGASLALLTGTKVNGIILIPLIAVVLFTASFKKQLIAYSYSLIAIFTSFLLCFLLIHPNFFFYPSVTPVQMMQGRLLITKEHIAYFGKHDPKHVILTFREKLTAGAKSIFPKWIGITAFVGLVIRAVFLFQRKKYPFVLLFDFGFLYIWLCITSYVVFDEPRYFLPILPFLILSITYSYSLLGALKHV